ncbi:aldehyde dehydrogenase [Brevundimonas vesicularis]|uniref:aldehyde dehydrogenase n=1 Tax=Brevundimonas vesicularis TaxID=41276 RepID=UPI0038D51924
MMLDVINPATEAVICQIAEDDAKRVDTVVRLARAAFEDWRATSVPERQATLRKVANVIRAHADELAELETQNTGILLKDAKDRYLVRTAANFDFFADYIGQSSGQVFEQHPTYVTTVRREAIGVAGLIAPWNLPLALGSMKIAAAIAFGNACVIKPSEIAPLAVIRLVEIISEVLPKGLVGIVNGRGHITGSALVDHDLVDLISFTGGTETGQRIAAAAGAKLKPVTMELGGKSANIIFDSADLDRALDAALVSIYANNGQQCLAGSRILIHDTIADRFIAAFVERARKIRIGSPLDPLTQLGPVATAAQRDRMLTFFEEAVAQGALPLVGGQRAAGLDRGYFVEPLAVEAPSNDLGVCQEEIFGPFAVFIRFKDAEEAFRLANGTRFGLASYVWTQNLALAMEAQERLEAGVVWINTPVVREMRAPFGGYKQSGIGAQGGAACEAFYSREKTITLPRRIEGLPIERLGI